MSAWVLNLLGWALFLSALYLVLTRGREKARDKELADLQDEVELLRAKTAILAEEKQPTPLTNR